MDMVVNELPDSGRAILTDSRCGAMRVLRDGKRFSDSRKSGSISSFDLAEYWAFSAFRLVDVNGGLQETWPRDQYRQLGEKA
jgi:hypothetical protein